MAADVLPIVLVHGAWHGAWSWSALQHALDGRGFPSYALDLPGRGASPDPPSGLDGDISAVIASVRAVGRPVVLVGHSYGGAVVSGAAESEPLVAAVIYVAAFALVAGESVMGFLRTAPRHPVRLSALMRPQPDGSIVLDPDRAGQIYGGGLAEPELRAHIARLGPQPADTFTGTVGGDPFGRVPTSYVLCERDDGPPRAPADHGHALRPDDRARQRPLPDAAQRGSARRCRGADHRTQRIVKVRVGFGLGRRTTLHDDRYGHVVDELERLGFDSLWLSERIGSSAPDPLVAMAYGAGARPTSSSGRASWCCLVAIPSCWRRPSRRWRPCRPDACSRRSGSAPSTRTSSRRSASPAGERATWFDESVAVMRRCWSGEPVDHDGARFHYDGVAVRPAPARLDVWLGGVAPSETPPCGAARRRLVAVVRHTGRCRSGAGRDRADRRRARPGDPDDHFGVLLPYTLTGSTMSSAHSWRSAPDLSSTTS